jgi:hypothetical protein
MNYSPDTLNTKIAVPPQRAHAFIYPLDRRLLQFAFICNQRRRPRVPHARRANYCRHLWGSGWKNRSSSLLGTQSRAIGTIVSVCKFTGTISPTNAKPLPRKAACRTRPLGNCFLPVIKTPMPECQRTLLRVVRCIVDGDFM